MLPSSRVPNMPFNSSDSSDSQAQATTQSLIFPVLDESLIKRLDQFLTDALAKTEGQQLSREKIKKAITSGQVKLNGQVCTSAKQPLKIGDELCIELVVVSNNLQAESGYLKVIEKLGDILILDKEAGLTVHPCDSQPSDTLVQRVLSAYPQLAKMEGMRPGIVHRLDKHTSGLLMVALSEPMRLALCKDFAERNIHKKYLALVYGEPQGKEGRIEAPIGRHHSIKTRMAVVSENKGGRDALTFWKKVWVDPHGRFSLLEVEIITGRTHQIRVHLTHLGHSLLGDKVYVSPCVSYFKEQNPAFKLIERQMLHAWSLNFTYPSLPCVSVASENEAPQTDYQNTEHSFFSAPPEDFVQTAINCSSQAMQIVLTGSAGSGKSTVLKAFADLGFNTWSADAVVAKLYQQGSDAWALIDKNFTGRFTRKSADSEQQAFYDLEPTPVNKRALLAAIKENPSIKRDLEEIVHPFVKHDLDNFFKAGVTAEKSAGLVAEVPLFFEASKIFNPKKANSSNETDPLQRASIPCPYVVAVSCQKNIRDTRLRDRGLSEEDIALLCSWQLPEEKKNKNADAIINNNSNLEQLKTDVLSLSSKISELSASCNAEFRKIIVREE